MKHANHVVSYKLGWEGGQRGQERLTGIYERGEDIFGNKSRTNLSFPSTLWISPFPLHSLIHFCKMSKDNVTVLLQFSSK